ncbi:polysaccharide biosynthesis tyrosine autokinase [Glycomyces sp. NRRL B-16210]|uniref:polysaccharide biosynthesis tyrosine autokinase n=1 Tax=Glycomyces sp. NRRL B-16210 TaxID=1463821 RepID=UPI00068DEC3C|nr:polysaccharide biosynthesis tyrosine autokinase [Glycomyces sp. NRRL B-16210]
MELRTGVRLLRERWLLITAAVAIALATAGLLTWKQTPQYTSSVTFFISAWTDPGDVASAYQGGLLSEQKVRSYAELLRTRSVMGGVIEDLALDLTPEELATKVTTSVVPDTSLLNATVTDASPAEARRIARSIGEHFAAVVPTLENSSDAKQAAVKVTVVNEPELATAPVTPKPVRNLALAAALGLLAGIGLAVARRALDTTVKSAEELQEHSGVPTLGTVAADRKLAKAPLIVHDPHGVRAEEVRRIRTNLQFVDVDRPHKVILVSGALGNEGKTTTSCNLAISIAETGKRVMLIDADLRKPRAASFLGLPNGAGLTDVLVDTTSLEAAVQPWGTDLLTVLSSGSTPPNPSELLGSRQMRELLDELRSFYDVVVIDGPPLLRVADAAATAASCDGVLLVVRKGRTRREQLKESLELLGNVKAPVIGAVLNFAAPSKHKSYGYGSPKADRTLMAEARTR